MQTDKCMISSHDNALTLISSIFGFLAKINLGDWPSKVKVTYIYIYIYIYIYTYIYLYTYMYIYSFKQQFKSVRRYL